MSHPDLLPLELQLPALGVLLAFVGWVVILIRRQRLSLRDSLVWLLTTLFATLVTAFPGILVRIAAILHIRVPANAIFAMALLYLAMNLLALTLAASDGAARVRRVVQECALLRAEVDALRARCAAAEARARDAERT